MISHFDKDWLFQGGMGGKKDASRVEFGVGGEIFVYCIISPDIFGPLKLVLVFLFLKILWWFFLAKKRLSYEQ